MRGVTIAIFGGAHAEVDCLSRYRGPLQGTTMYVTLEPCSHYGKTPPVCAVAGIHADRAHSSLRWRTRIRSLRERGSSFCEEQEREWTWGCMAEEAADLNRQIHPGGDAPSSVRSCEGRANPRWKDHAGRGKDRWVTGPEARQVVHAMRTDFDAVLVGAGTVVNGRSAVDGPRDAGERSSCGGAGRRIADAFFCEAHQGRKTADGLRRDHDAGDAREPGRAAELARAGVQVIGVDGKRGRFALTEVLGVLYDEGIGSLLVEGGARRVRSVRLLRG